MLNKITTSPPFRIAIVGGGQLGKMMTVAAKQLGFYVIVLDPTPDCPAAQVADRQVVAPFTDGEAIRTLAEAADVITYEFEHIDTSSLIELEDNGYPVFPTARLLRVIQDKLLQKNTLRDAGIPVSPFLPINCLQHAEAAAAELGFPLILKSCRGGYDGKGNALVQAPVELKAQFDSLKTSELMAEAFVPFSCEVSVMVARGRSGEIRSYPLSENEHADNILRQSIVPARVSDVVEKRARKVAEDVMALFCGVGVFCVEMFVTEDKEILVNEVAPRPHNSGHYTIEACVTSQFEQHIRAIAGLPLGDTTLLRPAVMINLLGEEGHHGPAVLDGVGTALSLPGAHLHFYSKKITSPMRKMGHVTITAAKLSQALHVAASAREALRVISQEGDG